MLENPDIGYHLCQSLVKKHDGQYVYDMSMRAWVCVCVCVWLTSFPLKISTNVDCAFQKCVLPTSQLNT